MGDEKVLGIMIYAVRHKNRLSSYNHRKNPRISACIRVLAKAGYLTV